MSFEREGGQSRNQTLLPLEDQSAFFLTVIGQRMG